MRAYDAFDRGISEELTVGFQYLQIAIYISEAKLENASLHDSVAHVGDLAPHNSVLQSPPPSDVLHLASDL